MNYSSEFLTLRKKIIENDFKKMNPMQKKAVFTTEGPVLILAGAGSGKTTVLVNRIANLIKYGTAYNSTFVPSFIDNSYIEELKNFIDHQDLNNSSIQLSIAVEPVKPWQILAITFTNKAANELKERLKNMLGENGDGIWASTFHSACAKILRIHADKLGYSKHFTVYDTDDIKRLIKNCQQSLNIDEKTLSLKSIMYEISHAKDELLNPSDYEKNTGTDFRKIQIAKIYSMYQKHLVEADAMDFDDLILNTVKLFKKCKDVLEYYQDKFKYVMIDEYQDTNKVQYEFIKLICGKYKNLCVVGDDDQSIYKFRGATIENIMNFEKTYKNALIIKLEQNYRSTKNILDAANAVIEHNSERKGKTLWTENSTGDKIHIHTSYNEFDEAEYIAKEIIDMASKGKKFSDFSILYRINAQSNNLERVFVQFKIPYKIIGGHKFYDRKEIRDMLAYLSVIENPNDEIRLRRIINVPKRGIGDKTILNIIEISDQTGESMINIMRHADEYSSLLRSANKLKSFTELIDNLIQLSNKPNSSISELYNKIIEVTGYIESLKAEKDEAITRIENIQELLSNIIKYEQDNGENASLNGFLEEVSLMTDIDNYDNHADAVSMMTVHSAKGLEFPVIFLPGFEEGIFPGVQAMYNPKELEEERRLAYVAITRAKEQLYIINTAERVLFGSASSNEPSRFSLEIPSELIDKTESERAKKCNFKNVDLNKFKTTNKTLNSSKTFGPFIGKSNTSKMNFSIGDKVCHKVFGQGVILSLQHMGNDTLLEINFKSIGNKKVMANFAKLEPIYD